MRTSRNSIADEVSVAHNALVLIYAQSLVPDASTTGFGGGRVGKRGLVPLRCLWLSPFRVSTGLSFRQFIHHRPFVLILLVIVRFFSPHLIRLHYCYQIKTRHLAHSHPGSCSHIRTLQLSDWIQDLGSLPMRSSRAPRFSIVARKSMAYWTMEIKCLNRWTKVPSPLCRSPHRPTASFPPFLPPLSPSTLPLPSPIPSSHLTTSLARRHVGSKIRLQDRRGGNQGGDNGRPGSRSSRGCSCHRSHE